MIMELKDFIENFANQFDDTELSEFKEETIYKELDEWSSLIALGIIAMIDEEYDITINGDDIRNSDTIKDLFNTIKAKV
jgi:acyl carrier protein